MNDRIQQLVALACADPANESFAKRLTTLVLHECIYTIQRSVTRSGHTPANERSWKHIEEICARFDVEVPTMYSHEFLANYAEATKCAAP